MWYPGKHACRRIVLVAVATLVALATQAQLADIPADARLICQAWQIRPDTVSSQDKPTGVAQKLIGLYQRHLTQQLAGQCMYRPTCSQFTMQLINEYGWLRGMIFGTDRLMRCNSLARMDIPQWQWNTHTHKVHEDVQYYQLPN